MTTNGMDRNPRRDPELTARIRQGAVRTVLSIVLLMAAVGVASVAFEAELYEATGWIMDRVGLVGLLVALLANEALISPIAPDFFLVIIAKSDLHRSWWVLVPLCGLISAVGGSLGWAIGFRLGEVRVVERLLRGFRSRHRELITRYGAWAVALAALTPLPYSVTCWTAGTFRMRWRMLAAVSLLRVPRFVLYYLAIVGSDPLMRSVI